jgi:hypothetical protein
MRLRRGLQGLGVAFIGLAIAVAPMATASASSHKAKHAKHAKHSTSKKGVNTGSALCTSLKSEESSSSKLGDAVSAAFESGNFATAKQDMLNSLNLGLKEVTPALAALRSAPANVQTAMKGLFKFEDDLKTAIENSTSMTSLESSFEALGKNPQLQANSTTVTNYITQQCGSLIPTTTAP